MKKILISIFLCLPLLLCAQSGSVVDITGRYTAVLYDPATPPVTADLGSEWFWDLDENKQPSDKKPIVEPWKCPYHNGRAG